MGRITGAEPRMWGERIVGFGEYRFRYASGREGDWFVTGFSPRKDTLTLYIMSGFEPLQSWLARLGKYRLGVGCLYIKKLADVDGQVLEELITESVRRLSGKED